LRKVRNSKLALVLVFAMLATLFVGVGTASAGTTYSQATSIPEFDPANTSASTLTTAQVHIKFDPAIAGNSTAFVEVVDADGALLDIVSAAVYDVEGTSTGSTCTQAGSANLYKLSLNGVTPAAGKYGATLQLTINAKDCAAGDVKVRFSSPSGQLVAGELVVAKATGGNVSVAMVSVPAFGDNGGKVTFRIRENAAGALKDKANTIKFKFPNGFTVGTPTATVISGKYGAAPGTAHVPADFTFGGTGDRDVKVTLGTGKASTVEKIMLDVTVPVTIDESTASTGDVMVTISGESTVTNTEIKAATYGNYSVDVSAKTEKGIQPGQYDQELGKILVKESLPGSLVKDRTITFTLPDGCKWNTLPSLSASDSKNIGTLAVSAATLVGSDKRICKITVNEKSNGTKSTEIVFKGGSITAAADFTGDVVVKVDGTAGAKGEAKIGVATAPITASVDKVPDVVIGQSSQVAVALTITEAKAEALKKSMETCNALPPSFATAASTRSAGELVLKAPPGVRFADAPTVKVVEGDIDLGTVSYDNDNRTITIKVDSVSGKASKIEISNLKLIVDRTVPEGDIVMEIGGSALVENDEGAPVGVANNEWFSNKHWVTKVAVAKVVTPAPGQVRATTVLVAGSTTMKVNGADVTMDVAPYLKNDRLFVSVRFAARGLGVDDNNILWDQATKTATLITADGRYIQMTLGSKVMNMSGARITMDVAPEMVSNRVMLPVGWLAKALGATATWDNATSTATLEL